MSFTQSQIDKAIAHLNYPVLQWTTTLFFDRMNDVSRLSSASEVRVIAILTTLDMIETAMNTYSQTSSGVQVSLDRTVYYRSSALPELKSQYKYWVFKLSTALSISINFSSFPSLVRTS